MTAEQEQHAIRALRTFGSRCALVAVTPEVLERAGRPFPREPVRTLDAIHLATMELIGNPPQLMTVLTRDARVRENALALGHPIT